MRIGQSSSMRLVSVDYIYLLLSCVAGVWQAWCANYGRNDLLVILIALFSLPFALASYAHESLLGSTWSFNWKRMLVLWAGMPLALILGSLTTFGETGLMYAAGFGRDNPPYYSLRLLIGEGAACLVWAECLLIWSHQSRLRFSRDRLLAAFAALYVAVLAAHGLSVLFLRNFHKDFFVLLTSIAATAISSMILIFLRREKPERTGDKNRGWPTLRN
jgi:hypothetical protein